MLTTLTGILQLIAGLTPTVSNVIMLFHNLDGSTTAIISSAQTATQTDIQQMQAYLQAHQTTPVQPVAVQPVPTEIKPAA